MKLKLEVYEGRNWLGDACSEELTGETEDGTEVYYRVHDLTECPEDATISRDLFSANDYIKALKLGMKLAKEGYTDIEVVRTEEE